MLTRYSGLWNNNNNNNNNNGSDTATQPQSLNCHSLNSQSIEDITKNETLNVEVHYVQSSLMKLLDGPFGKSTPIPPEQFFVKLLSSRGYKFDVVISSQYKKIPTQKQMNDYNNQLVWAVRTSNLEQVKKLHSEHGMSMSACNKFSESIVHMACRRSNFEIVEYLLQNGADISIVDDYGRNPLHDACWRTDPRFDIVSLLLDKDLNILRYVDRHGCIPLRYVKEEHWIQWCGFLFYLRDRYWPKLDADHNSSNNSVMNTFNKDTLINSVSVDELIRSNSNDVEDYMIVVNKETSYDEENKNDSTSTKKRKILDLSS
eukprot:gene13338-17890_t